MKNIGEGKRGSPQEEKSAAKDKLVQEIEFWTKTKGALAVLEVILFRNDSFNYVSSNRARRRRGRGGQGGRGALVDLWKVAREKPRIVRPQDGQESAHNAIKISNELRREW